MRTVRGIKEFRNEFVSEIFPKWANHYADIQYYVKMSLEANKWNLLVWKWANHEIFEIWWKIRIFIGFYAWKYRIFALLYESKVLSDDKGEDSEYYQLFGIYLNEIMVKRKFSMAESAKSTEEL